VGHYGIFNGSRFRREVAPRVSMFLRTHASRGPLETLRRLATPYTSAIIANMPNGRRIPEERLNPDPRILLRKPSQRRSWNSGLRSITSRTNQHSGTTLRFSRRTSLSAPRTSR